MSQAEELMAESTSQDTPKRTKKQIVVLPPEDEIKKMVLADLKDEPINKIVNKDTNEKMQIGTRKTLSKSSMNHIRKLCGIPQEIIEKDAELVSYVHGVVIDEVKKQLIEDLKGAKKNGTSEEDMKRMQTHGKINDIGSVYRYTNKACAVSNNPRNPGGDKITTYGSIHGHAELAIKNRQDPSHAEYIRKSFF